MDNWITRVGAPRRAGRRRRQELEQLAALPGLLLYDIGIGRDGIPSLAGQLGSDRVR